MQTSTRGRSSNRSTIIHRSCATEARDWRVLKRGRHAKSRWKPVVYIYIYTRDMEPLCKRTCSIGDTLQAPSVLNHRQTPQGCRSNSLGVTSIGFIGFVKEPDRRRGGGGRSAYHDENRSWKMLPMNGDDSAIYPFQGNSELLL